MSCGRRLLSSPTAAQFANRMRQLGAIAHFDPSWGATDNGTTSTWIDRIGGNTVTSEAQASRLVFSSSLASLGGMPGWSGTSAANSHLVNTASTPLGVLMAGLLPHTIYTVRRATLTTPSIYFSSSRSGGTDYWYTGNVNSVNNSNYVRQQAGQTNNSSIIRHTTEPIVAVHTFTGSTGGVHDNGGVGVAPAANTKNLNTNNLCVGGLIQNTGVSLCFDGDIADLIVFGSAHTDAERRQVEQLIALKYSWPVIQGLSGFTTNDFLSTAIGAGVRGADGVGVWTDVLLRPDATPSGTQYVISAFQFSGLKGYATLFGSSGETAARNGVATAFSPVLAVAADKVGKLSLHGMASNASLVDYFVDGVRQGAGSALAGFLKADASTYRCQVGGVQNGASGNASPCSSFSLFGAAGGDVAQNATDQTARAAAIKAAKAYVATGGATPTHGWALNSIASSYSDLVGSDALTLAGTLSAAQIIVTSWPW